MATTIKRLLPTHPTHIKFEKICALADELGISFEFIDGVCVLRDRAQPGMNFTVKDVDNRDAQMTTFPYPTEVKILVGEF